MQTVFYFLNRKAALAGLYKREMGTYDGLNYHGGVRTRCARIFAYPRLTWGRAALPAPAGQDLRGHERQGIGRVPGHQAGVGAHHATATALEKMGLVKPALHVE